MAISKNKDKHGRVTSYRAVLYDNKRKISQRSFKRKIDAQRWLREQKLRLELGHDTSLSFKKACEDWLKYYSISKHSPSTANESSRMIHKIFVPLFGHKKLEDLSTRDIEQLVVELKDKGHKVSTRNRYLQTLKCILNYYCKKEYLQKNVVAILGLDREEPTQAKFLSIEQAKAFLMHVNAKYQGDKRWIYVLYVLALNTGMRIGEILGLKWDCIDFLGRRITIRRSYCYHSKQIRETTKGHRVRHIGMNSSLYPELDNLWKQRTLDDDLVFSNSHGQVINISNFKRDHYSKDLEEVSLPWIKIHELRHSFASHFVMNKGNLYDLQKLLGHSNIKTTERYAHLSPDHLIHQTERVAIDGKENVIDASNHFKKRASNQ